LNCCRVIFFDKQIQTLRESSCLMGVQMLEIFGYIYFFPTKFVFVRLQYHFFLDAKCSLDYHITFFLHNINDATSPLHKTFISSSNRLINFIVLNTHIATSIMSCSSPISCLCLVLILLIVFVLVFIVVVSYHI
jgi:hypothetical protein